MLGLSVASRLVAAELAAPSARLAAVAVKAVSSVAATAAVPFSTLMQSRASTTTPTMVSMPSALALPSGLLSRGLATRTGKAGAKRKATSGQTKASSTTGRGARNAKKKSLSDAAKRAKANAAQRQRKQKEAREQKRKTQAAKRAARVKKEAEKREKTRKLQAKRRAARQARERELSKLRAEQRKKATARRQQSRQKQHDREVQRKARARAALSRRRLTAKIVEQARRAVARTKAFFANHPQEARRRKVAAATGLTKPRKPASMMAAYLKQNFQRVKAELQGKAAGGKVPGPTVVREIAAQFKALPAEQKSQLEQDYRNRLQAYQQQINKFNEQMPPKRPPTAYISYFVRVQGDVARANPGLSVSDLAKRVAEQWRALGASEKASLQSASEREMSAWKDRLAAWHDAHPGAGLHKPTSVAEVAKELKAKRMPPKADKDKKTPAIKKGRKTKGKKAQPAAA